MPTLAEIREQVIREDSAGLFTDETRLDYGYVNGLIHAYRADAIFAYWQKTKRINPLWLQTYYLEYEKDIQEDDCFVRFACPPVISVDSQRIGFVFVGNGMCQYTILNNRADAANAAAHRYMKPTTTQAQGFWSDGFLELYGNSMIKGGRVDAMFMNPEDVPTYNVDYDQYPVCGETLVMLKALLYQKEGQLLMQRPADTISDSQDTLKTTAAQPQQ